MLNLQRVIGSSISNPNHLAICQESRRIAYLAGNCVVLQCLETGRESYLSGDIALTTVVLSPSAQHLATSDITGRICVYSLTLKEGRIHENKIHELRGHTEIVCMSFLPNSSHLVSVGSQNDGHLVLWDFLQGHRIADSKLTAQVLAMGVSTDGQTIVTVGVKHVKYWNMGVNIQSRSAILADRRNSIFSSCTFIEPNRLLASTNDGAVIEFFNKKYVKAHELRDCYPTVVSHTRSHVVVGTSTGDVQLWSRNDLSLLGILPRTAPAHCDPAIATTADKISHMGNENLPPVSALVCLCEDVNVIVSANISSLFIHSAKEDNKWLRMESKLFENSKINRVLMYPSSIPLLPENSFISAHGDGTIRMWNIHQPNTRSSVPPVNFLSATMKKTISVAEPGESASSVTALSLSVDGKQLAAGTSNGSIHVFDVCTWERLEFIEAHESEVTVLQHTNTKTGVHLMASGSSDRLLHVFHAGPSKCDHIDVVEFHKSPIAAIQFIQNSDGLHMVSCSRENAVLLTKILFQEESIQISIETQISFSANLSDISRFPVGNTLLSLEDNGEMTTFSLSGRKLHSFAVENGARMEKLHLDPSGALAVCASSAAVHLLDARSGQALSTLPCQNVTAMEFTDDLKRLIVCADGCFFVYRIASHLVQRMENSRRNVEESITRCESLDSLLGSGSEALTDELITIEDVSVEFGSQESLPDLIPQIFTLPTVSASGFHLSVSSAQTPTRRSSNNLREDDSFCPSDEESRSEFISRQREPTVRQYETSKSMLNLREDHGIPLSGGNHLGVERTRRSRPAWGQPPPTPEYEWRAPPAPAVVKNWAEPRQAPVNSMNMRQYPIDYESPAPIQHGRYSMESNNNFEKAYSPMRQTPISAASTGLAQIQSSRLSKEGQAPPTGLRRDGIRISLTRKHLTGNGNTQPQAPPETVWSAERMTPRRTFSSINPTGASASAISRRQSQPGRPINQRNNNTSRANPVVIMDKRAEDYTASLLHLRSRSQSPNHLAMQLAASREHTKDLQKRRDSDMSYTAASMRMTPATSRTNLRDADHRKSTDALNKLAAARNKLHQSSENLGKSTENLSVSMSSSALNPSVMSRTRSISNIRNNLENMNMNEADAGRSTSLAHSRLLARSMGNVSQSGRDQDASASAASRLQNTLAMLKKASNPDLTETSLYDDNTDSVMTEKTRRRGAVQKKVERYHPRMRNTRQPTSEESDSTASDASPLNGSFRRNNARSISSVESPTSRLSTIPSRRLFDQPSTAPLTPRRTNYLAQKLANEEGPDLGSDDSPRSSVNASEWLSLLDESSDCQQLVKHVQDCCDQHQVYTDKLIQAKRMVEDSVLTSDQKRIIAAQIDRVSSASIDKLSSNQRRPGDSNGNDYTPIKGPNIYSILKQNMSSC